MEKKHLLMGDHPKTCPFSRGACRDCPAFRGRHYFYCHPSADLEALFRPWGEPSRPEGEEGTVWYRDLFEGAEEAPLPEAELTGLLERADWDFWPAEDERSPVPPTRDTGPPHFAIDVWCGTATLMWMEPRESEGGWTSRRVESGIPPSLLSEAVLENGGQLHFAGTYPVNRKVRAWLASNRPQSA